MQEVQLIIALRMVQAQQEAVQERHPYKISVDAECQWIHKLASQEAGTEELQMGFHGHSSASFCLCSNGHASRVGHQGPKRSGHWQTLRAPHPERKGKGVWFCSCPHSPNPGSPYTHPCHPNSQDQISGNMKSVSPVIVWPSMILSQYLYFSKCLRSNSVFDTVVSDCGTESS